MAHISDAGGQWKTTVEITNITELANCCPGAESSYTAVSSACSVMPNGSLMTLISAKYSTTSDFSPQDIFVSYSYDGGLTWTAPQLFLDNISDSMVYDGLGVQNGNDNVGIFAGRCIVVVGNRMWMPIAVKPTTCTGVTGKVYNFMRYSDDNGSTWSQLINVTDRCNLITKFDNYLLITEGNAAYLKNGRLIFPGWFYNRSHGNYDVFAIYTDNQEDGLNATFNTTSVFGTSEEFSEWSIVQLKNYTLYGTVRDGAKQGGPHYRFATWSMDNGSTWTEPTYPDTSLLDPESMGSIIRYTTDTEYDKNRILLAWNNDSSSRNHLTVAISYDECQTFPVRRELGDGLEYPYLCVTENKSIICTYNRGHWATVVDADIFNLEWLSGGSDYLAPPSNTSASDSESFGISLPVDYTATSSSHEYSIASFGISLPIDHTAADNNGSGFIISDSDSFYATIAGLAVFFPILGLLIYKEKRR